MQLSCIMISFMRPKKIDVQKLLSSNSGPMPVAAMVSKLNVNKTTVYRQLDQLLKSGIVCEVEFGDGKKRYEFATDGHHHHLICNNCHVVTCLELDRDLESLEKKIKARNGFNVLNHNLEFFGTCRACHK